MDIQPSHRFWIAWWCLPLCINMVLIHCCKHYRTSFLMCTYRKRQKFRGWKVSWFAGMRGKVSRFFPSLPPYIHGFQLYKTATSVSTKASHSSREFSLKLSLTYWEMDERTLLDTCVQISRFPGWPCSQQEEKRYSWSEFEMKQITNHFLVSFFCKLIPGFFATTMEYFL